MPVELNAPSSSAALASAASPPPVARRVRLAGLLTRTVFILLLAVIIGRVSLPQSEDLWTVYETPGDLVRLLLGVAICSWIVWQMFQLPKDAEAYWTWIYFGLAGVPFALICLFAIW
jgi:hypothetical protein